MLRLYQDKKGWMDPPKSASSLDVLKKEGEIHLTKYTVIKLYTGGRKGAGSALEQGARSDLRLALFPLTGTVTIVYLVRPSPCCGLPRPAPLARRGSYIRASKTGGA